MSFYINSIVVSLKTELSYRANTLIRMITLLSSVFIQYFIWKALLPAGVSANGVDYQYMSTYVILSTLISVLLPTTLINDVDGQIKSGQVVLNLLRPVKFKAILISNAIGKSLFSLLANIPVLITALLLFPLQLHSLQNMMLFLISIILGVQLYYSISYILGLLGFWFVQIWILARFLSDFTRFFAGALIPLVFFPDILLKISKFLPFKYMYYSPIDIFIRASGSEAIDIILRQIIWIISLHLLQAILWKFAIKKLVILGG